MSLSAENPEHLERLAPEEIEAGDVTYEESLSFISDTTSLSSTAFNYTYENGRRYHSFREGKYVLPNDDREQDRLDMIHHVWNIMHKGSLSLAPIRRDEPINVLDLGAGTGIWTIDFADEYPNATVIGTDLSPIQPTWVPPNVRFEIDDAEDPWTWPEDHFDLVHIRNLVGSIKSWPDLFKTVLRHLKPGGYIELHESDMSMLYSDDGTLSQENAIYQYMENLNKAATMFGRPLNATPLLSGMLKEAGFTDIEVRIQKWPMGAWPKQTHYKELGVWGSQVVETGAEAYGLALLTRVLKMDEGTVKKFIEDFKREINGGAVHSYANNYTILGKKPQ